MTQGVVYMSSLYYATLAAYALTALTQGVRPGWHYRAFAVPALAVEAAYICVRWFHSGHPPMFGTFEESLMAAFAVTLAGVVFDGKGVFARFTAPFTFLSLVYGALFDAGIKPLIISEQSILVYIHVVFAWAAYGLYAVVFAAAVWCLVKKESGGRLVDWAMHEGLLYGFIFQTLYFAAGAYYSSRLHGRWWTWDMVEYLFVASWFMYSIAMHGRIFFGWGRRRVSAWIAAGFLTTMALYWAIIYMPWSSYHVFDVAIKIHSLWR